MEIAIKLKVISFICAIFVFIVIYIELQIEIYNYPWNNFIKNSFWNQSDYLRVSKEKINGKISLEEIFNPITTLTKEEKNMKKILVWHFASTGLKKCMGIGYGNAPFIYDKCEESRCIITDNRTLLPVTDYDAVLFHLKHIEKIKLPAHRSNTQRWIFFETEPATFVFNNIERFNNLFNWTMTYRLDSDIIYRYGHFEPINYPVRDDSIDNNFNGKKEKMVAWIVSSCKTNSSREYIVKELSKYIKVDIYGKCGNMSCLPRMSASCYEMIEENYKFYLSFENSYCKDYVTEKLYKILRYKIVPVVYGNVNYSFFSPPHSVIDIRKFSNVKDLADYLIYLDKNITAYNEYFRWKQKYRILSERETRAKSFCSLCKALHTTKEQKIYPDISQWFIRKGKCQNILPLWFNKE